MTNPKERNRLSFRVLVFWIVGAVVLGGCSSGAAPPPLTEVEGAPADQNIGERLFVETRFAEYFAANMT
ncbi:MAG TPA: hypothetical protein VMB02_00645, partial [Candidatus Aquilonibacter sp.]|nr:hypothetical protein [Candidatus Aquilonibacter sp.]